MEDTLRALQEIQKSLRGVQAQISSKKHGFKLPGMEEDEEEGGELVASSGLSQRSPIVSAEEEVEEEKEEGEMPMDASGEMEKPSMLASAEEPMEEDEVEEDNEMMGKPKGKKPVAKLMAIKALINQPAKKLA